MQEGYANNSLSLLFKASVFNIKMEALKELVFNHRFTINKMRTNINDDIGYFGPKKKPFLIKGVYSNTV